MLERSGTLRDNRAMATKPKRPRDPNQLAKLIVDIATGEKIDTNPTTDGSDASAIALGRQGGLKGGRARSESLSSERKAEIARNAAQARWKRSG